MEPAISRPWNEARRIIDTALEAAATKEGAVPYGFRIVPTMALNAFRSFNLHQFFDPEPGHGSPKGWSDEAHLEMRAAGRRFGLMAADLGAGTSPPAGDHGTRIPRGDVAEHIRSRACRLSDSLRNERISPRQVEALITTWVSAAHEAACERLGKQIQ